MAGVDEIKAELQQIDEMLASGRYALTLREMLLIVRKHGLQEVLWNMNARMN